MAEKGAGPTVAVLCCAVCGLVKIRLVNSDQTMQLAFIFVYI